MLDGACSDKRFIMQVLGTGTGKSLCYIAQALMGGTRAVVLTATKALQQQLLTDFAEIGLTDVRGANAYPCHALAPGGEHEGLGGRGPGREYRCDEGPCQARIRCSLFNEGCAHFDAVRAAGRARLVVTNYSFWLAKRRAELETRGKSRTPQLGRADLLILDEAHDADAELASFLVEELTDRDVRLVGMPPDNDAGADSLKAWAAEKAAPIRAEVESQESAIREGYIPPGNELRQLYGQKTTLRKVMWLTEWREDWTYQRDGRTARFGPSNPAPWAEKYLFQDTPKVILTSATVTKRTAGFLGIPDEELEVVEYPSPFPVQRRPVYVVPTVRMTHRVTEAELDVWLSRIDFIISRRLDRKGIIHTTAYHRARWIAERSKYSHLMLTHDTRSTRRVIEEFKASDAPKILVSPSVTTGYDFPGAECRYIVIAKVPFPTMTDRFVKARQEQDGDYSAHMAMQTLVQSAGRGMRSADDQCETMVVDGMAVWFLRKNAHLAPKWFNDAVRQPTVVPDPPRLEGG